MQKLLCAIGIHKYRTVDMTDAFTTSYTDKPYWPPIKHMVWYQQCTCCGKRRMKDTVKRDSVDSTRHNGVEYARTAWVEHGRMYIGNGTWNATPKPKPAAKVVPFTVHDGGKK